MGNNMHNSDLPPFRPNHWEDPKITVTVIDNGEQIVESPRQPSPVPANVVVMFQQTVAKVPDHPFLARRNAEGEWVKLSYREADQRSDAVAQWLLSLGLAKHTPVMILSENSLEHAIFMFGALKAGMPVAPVSPSYSLLSADHQKVKRIFEMVEPGVVFVQDADKYGRALTALSVGEIPVVTVQGQFDGARTVSFADVESTEVTDEVAASIAAIEGDSVAKILFTSGSTGEPKGVVNTHTNLCSPPAQLDAVGGIATPPVFLDWLPWHHTFGGNQNMHRIIYYCGTMYIDDGKPLPGLFETTIKNLRDLQVTLFTTVPAVFPILLDVMEQDPVLRKNFFAKLESISYGGSDMPQTVFDRIQKMAIEETGQRIAVLTALGSTESSAIITAVHWNNERMGNIGLPTPGSVMKLIPLGDKFEMRIKGPQMTSGYFKAPDKTAEAFDEEGFFRTGDAVRWADESDPNKGLLFAGRVAEDFKLLSGTWVHTGSLRNAVVSALGPLVLDVVITGQDKEYIGAMVWPNETGIRAVLKEPDMPMSDLLQLPAFRSVLQQRLQAYNEANSQASCRIRRLLILTEPPSLDDNEITDKRYVNQRAVLDRRTDQVERLYSERPDAAVFVG